MDTLRKNITFIIITVVLILVGAFCICGTVYSQEKGQSKVQGQSKEQVQHYRQIEHEYVKAMRDFLEEQGYRNSGVTMTYVVLEEGGREYTVMIHHKKISALEELQKEDLAKACGKIEFPIEDCTFFHEFLETDI